MAMYGHFCVGRREVTQVEIWASVKQKASNQGVMDIYNQWVSPVTWYLEAATLD